MRNLTLNSPFYSNNTCPADIMSIFYMIGVRHSKSRTEIMWKMSYGTEAASAVHAV